MSKTLSEVLGEIVIWGGEEGEYSWTLDELEDEASFNIRNVITDHLKTLKRPVATKLVFGDIESVKNADYNEAIDQLIMDIKEGKV